MSTGCLLFLDVFLSFSCAKTLKLSLPKLEPLSQHGKLATTACATAHHDLMHEQQPQVRQGLLAWGNPGHG